MGHRLLHACKRSGLAQAIMDNLCPPIRTPILPQAQLQGTDSLGAFEADWLTWVRSQHRYPYFLMSEHPRFSLNEVALKSDQLLLRNHIWAVEFSTYPPTSRFLGTNTHIPINKSQQGDPFMPKTMSSLRIAYLCAFSLVLVALSGCAKTTVATTSIQTSCRLAKQFVPNDEAGARSKNQSMRTADDNPGVMP